MRFLTALALFLFISLATRAAEPFEIKEGDRVLFLGDTLLEREGTYGYLETRMQEQFPDRHFTVRNLAFSADTPLGWSRASFDPAPKGFDRLKEQLDLVKPTVVFLGYGMAASLQEMTDRSGDPTLNADPARYGAEPMSAPRFKKELGQLMDAINAVDPATKVRFVLLSPTKHEDLRATRPGLPDPAKHNELLIQYSKAIEELAQERNARFVSRIADVVSSRVIRGGVEIPSQYETDNGIHPNEHGYQQLQSVVSEALQWSIPAPSADKGLVENEKALRTAIIRKNELFFHRWRPANSTYLFGFRKHEQGQNAKEIPEFDPLIAQEEAEIDRLKKQPANAAAPATAPTPVAALPTTAPAGPADAQATLPKPDFTVAEGYQIELWAENPLLYKPTQMNWDPQGRLWVSSSALYPQIAPGGEETDTIIVLEDTDHDGKADKSSVFAGGLLIPTGVQPAYLDDKDGKHRYGCYVGQSTELLYFEDSNGDGQADKKQIILSGFGTEDTHHIVHTLKRGPDRRLYFNQSVYIHTHLETPWGVVRLNAGGVLAWDARTEKVEVYNKGLWNTWGLQFDPWGQSFQTDGAGSTGISWTFPGATFAPSEGSRKTMQSISPGSYPKFAGLELIYSPHFPADWQGNAITCDFRAHRIVRFGVTDLAIPAAGAPKTEPATAAQSGFVTSEMPDLVRTSDVSFRPIDVKLGPDGALYVADWSNPVINHGEVDFRDPRRDHTHGRIWRISKKEVPAGKWEPLVGQPNAALLDKLLSPNLWEKEQARAVLGKRLVTEIEAKKSAARATGKLALGNDEADAQPEVEHWLSTSPSDERLREVAFLEASFSTMGWARFPGLSASADPRARALLSRLMAHQRGRTPNRIATATPAPATPAPNANTPNRGSLYFLPKLVADANPRVRLEALRALARYRNPQAIDLILDAAVAQSALPADPFLDQAIWQSVNDIAPRWTAAIDRGEWPIEGREKQLELGLGAIEPAIAGTTLAKLLASGKIGLDKGPWIELLGKAGGPDELAALFESLLISFGENCCPGRDMTAARATSVNEAQAARMIAALLEAARVRTVKPSGELWLAHLAPRAPEALRPGLAQLAGLWKAKDALEFLPSFTAEGPMPLRLAAIDGLKAFGGPDAQRTLTELCQPKQSFGIRRAALVALASQKLPAAIEQLAPIIRDAPSENEALATWRQILAVQGAAPALEKQFSNSAWTKDLPAPAIAAAYRASREAGRKTQALTQILQPLSGLSASQTYGPADYQAIASRMKSNGGDPAEGERIYRRLTSGCVTCHAIGGAGGIVGPSLTSIGASAPLDYIIESLLNPNAKVKEGYNAVTLKLKDGTEVSGIQARETAQEVILRSITGAETSVPKANITGKTDIGSIMPAGLVDQINDHDRMNLYSFLGELGKPGPFDASKGNVARVWRLYPGNQPDQALKQDVSGAPAIAYTLVDGRLLKDQSTEALQMVSNPGDTIFATAQFQVAAGGRTRLSLTGISKAWLDGQPLAVASEPNPTPELAAGVHTLAVKLDVKALPEILRAEAEGVNFLGN